MDVGEQLSERLWAADWRALDEFLQGLDAEDLARAGEAHEGYLRREWLERAQGLQARMPDQTRQIEFHRGEMLAAATLAATAKDALRGADWWHSWGGNDDWEFDGVVLERIASRGRRWVGSFVTEVAKGRVTGAGALVRHLLALIVHFDLPHPTGKFYRENWSSRLLWPDYPPQGDDRRRVHESQREWSLDAAGKRVPQTPTRYLPVIERMRREPHLRQLVKDTLATKRGMHDWDPKLDDPVQAALVELVDDGVFTREELIEEAWGILGRLDTPSAHRAAADLLLRLVDTDGLAAAFPMLLGCLTSVHGTVTSILLPHAIGAARDEDDVRALCDVIFARPEKRQRVVLLAALTAESAATRWSGATILECVRTAAEVDDVKLSAAARKALATLDVDAGKSSTDAHHSPEPAPGAWGDDGDVALSGLWRELDPVEDAPAPFVTLDGGQVVADAFNAARYTRTAIDTAALDVLMRWARSDRPRLEAWLQSFMGRPDAQPESFSFPAALSRWTWGALDQARRHTMVDRVRYYLGVDGGPRFPTYEPFPGDPVGSDCIYASPIDGFLALLAQESLARAGEVPFLLSCPSRVDGTVTFIDLVARIERYAGTPCGPLDLFQALVRLERVPPARLAELDGLTLPLWSDDHPLEQAQTVEDGVEIVRGWVRAGGLPALEVRFDAGYLVLSLSPWPDVVSAFPTLPPVLLKGLDWTHSAGYVVSGTWRGHYRRGDNRESMLAFPHWPDLFAVDVAPAMRGYGEEDDAFKQVMAMTGPAGPARQHLIVTALNDTSLERRLQGVDAAIALVASGRWNAQVHADVTAAYLRVGVLGLARSASAWHQLALAGELKAIWPTILAVLDAGAAMPRKPVGYPEVLAVARKLIGAVPDPTLPQSLHDLAAAKGSTRSHLEARALVGEAR